MSKVLDYLILALFPLFLIPFGAPLGILGLLILIGLRWILSLENWAQDFKMWLSLPFVALVAYLFAWTTITPTVPSLISTIKVIALFAVAFVFTKMRTNRATLLTFAGSFLVFSVIFFSGLIKSSFNPNYFGMIVFLSFAWIAKHLRDNIRSVAGTTLFSVALALILASHSRSILAALAAFGLLALLRPSEKTKRALFWLALVSGIALPALIMGHVDYRAPLLGKPFFSGRQFLWPYALQAISHFPLGLGPDLYIPNLIPTDYAEKGASFHNWYLQFGARFGLLGLCLFLTSLDGLIFSRTKNGPNRALESSFFIAFMLTQYFDVHLTENGLVVGLFAVLIFATPSIESPNKKSSLRSPAREFS